MRHFYEIPDTMLCFESNNVVSVKLNMLFTFQIVFIKYKITLYEVSTTDLGGITLNE